ncbi:hypothetical protein OO006_06885 [Prosthecochloris sp. SCSIO W1101]|uniref:hypothetical protein n=1 Tax=Prosthecochloris sp. SCSIO W1101 TaxID=2992242 RepID=UPI00223CDC38|nr:hypothetical protein [Prosthecochloris sp. SCSIO W1101]UZJ42664.1 hypothetical protein OO006_06885 [Prosthecochloris sp. SCSIO W1101]
MTHLLIPLVALTILTGSIPSNAEPYGNHPILRLFSQEKEESAKDTALVEKKEHASMYLQIWTGSGTIAQQNLFTFNEKATIGSSREKLNWWFRLQRDNKAEFAVWQVAESPFTDTLPDWKKPDGFVASGPVICQFALGNINFFEIEFEDFVDAQAGETSKKALTYYIRVIALDAMGEPVGSPSNTVIAYYGPLEP